MYHRSIWSIDCQSGIFQHVQYTLLLIQPNIKPTIPIGKSNRFATHFSNIFDHRDDFVNVLMRRGASASASQIVWKRYSTSYSYSAVDLTCDRKNCTFGWAWIDFYSKHIPYRAPSPSQNNWRKSHSSFSHIINVKNVVTDIISIIHRKRCNKLSC